MPSRAFGVFNRYNSKEVQSLSRIFRERNAGRGPNIDYGLLHGALILLVSGWETYCEDVSLEAVDKICRSNEIQFEDMPDNVKREILRYAWPERIDNLNLLTTDLARLPGTGWKSVFESKIMSFIRDFNTPKFAQTRGKNLTQLFGLYLSSDVVAELDRLSTLENLGGTVDNIVRVRGAIAHRGRPNAADHFYAEGLEEYLDQITKACAAIDCIIHSEFRETYEITPWRMTRTVTNHLPGYV